MDSFSFYLDSGILLSCAVVVVGTFYHTQRKEHQKKSRRTCEDDIVDDDFGGKIKEIRHNGRLYDVTKWIPRHPGGKVIEYYVNNMEDATEAITQFHFRSASRVNLLLKSLPNRRIPEQMIETSDKYREMSKDFQDLYLELKGQGYFNPSLAHVGARMAELAFLAGFGVGIIKGASGSDWAWMSLGIALLSLFQMRVAYFMHEAGHHSLTGKPILDRLIQTVVFGVGSGQSATWYRYHHSRHHAMPQRLHHDNDIDTLPGIAVNVKVVENPEQGINFFIRHQANLVVPVGATIGVMCWKLYLHPVYVLRRKLHLEAICMLLHYLIVLNTVGLIPYAISVVISISVIITNLSLSHTHLPVTEEPRHWVEYAFLHTMNVDPSWWCDWWTGYLNYQIEHHLFPAMPGFRQPQIRERVKEFAHKHDLPYICSAYVPTCFTAYNNMKNVAEVLVQLANN